MASEATRSDLLSQFKEITGWEDPELCQSYLSSSAWNLELALSNYFGMAGPTSTASPSTSLNVGSLGPSMNSPSFFGISPATRTTIEPKHNASQRLQAITSEVDNIEVRKTVLAESEEQTTKSCISLTEALMKLLEGLDAIIIQEDEFVLRQKRKELVVRVQKMIGELDALRKE